MYTYTFMYETVDICKPQKLCSTSTYVLLMYLLFTIDNKTRIIL